MLLLKGFRSMIDLATDELARHGHPDVRAGHEFAMRAILAGAHSASDLARRLSISKQAAAKVIATLEDRGYVARAHDPDDARRKNLIITGRGHEMLALGSHILEQIYQRWAARVGQQTLVSMTNSLQTLVDDASEPLDMTTFPSFSED